jgi:hypothetical protein
LLFTVCILMMQGEIEEELLGKVISKINTQNMG